MQTVSISRKESTYKIRSVFGKKVTQEPGWDHRFQVGDVVRTVGGSGSYNRGQIIEVAEEEKYYRVDYGLGFPSLIREENLEPFDEKNLLPEPPRSFATPIVPFMGIRR